MKHTKSILMTAVAALSIASASAQSVIYVTGATAFRKAANKNLYALYGDKLFATSGTATNSDSAVGLYFTNCSVNGQLVDIAVTWTGSEAGIQQVASGTNNIQVPYFDKAKIITKEGASVPPYLGRTAPNTTTFATDDRTSLQKGHVTFMDTFPDTSRWKPNVRAGDGKVYKGLTTVNVGVVPYTFMASKGFETSFPERNWTTLNAQQALELGRIAGNNVSGNSADADTQIWSMGRNIESGTRVITHAVTKYGTLTPVLQWRVTAATGRISTIVKHPATTLLGVGVALGNNGESSGSTMAGFLTNVITSTTAVTSSTGETLGSRTNYLVGYSSVPDTLPLVGSGLVLLKYNGVEGRCYSQTNATTLDAGYTNIITGKYPYWGYEAIGYDATLGNANVPVFVNTLADKIKALSSTDGDLAPNIALGDMQVDRSADGGPQGRVIVGGAE
jgi:hypothetical protein